MFAVQIRKPRFEGGEQVGFTDWELLFSAPLSEAEAKASASHAKRDNPECEFRVIEWESPKNAQ